MVAVNVEPFEIETPTRAGERVRAGADLPTKRDGPFPVPLAASPIKRLSATCPSLRRCSRSSSADRSSSTSTTATPPSRWTRRGWAGRRDWNPVSRYEGERLRLEISNWESAITEAPMTHWYGKKVGTDTYRHDATRPSRLRLRERARSESTAHQGGRA